MLSGDTNVNPGPTTIYNNKVPLNALPFYNCGEPKIPSKCDSSGYAKEHDNSKWNIFKKKKGLHILHLNVNSVLPEMDEIRFTAKQSNASTIIIIESKLDSSILDSEVDIMGYDISRMDCSRRGGGVACYIKKSLSYYHKLSFCPNNETIFRDIFLPKSKPILVGMLNRLPDKPRFLEYLDNSLK